MAYLQLRAMVMAHHKIPVMMRRAMVIAMLGTA
jgi:hypothetical protein